ncbi:MAG: hypothetical protein J6T98_02670 [Salinivirgaceae bacterium]|nr:hypothetical protein [Salinivirgaceae bacterium]
MIGSVIQKGTCIDVYDEKGYQMCQINVCSNSQLMGYTGSTFSVKTGNVIDVYDQKGRQLSQRSV